MKLLYITSFNYKRCHIKAFAFCGKKVFNMHLYTKNDFLSSPDPVLNPPVNFSHKGTQRGTKKNKKFWGIQKGKHSGQAKFPKKQKIDDR